MQPWAFELNSPGCSKATSGLTAVNSIIQRFSFWKRNAIQIIPTFISLRYKHVRRFVHFYSVIRAENESFSNMMSFKDIALAHKTQVGIAFVTLLIIFLHSSEERSQGSHGAKGMKFTNFHKPFKQNFTNFHKPFKQKFTNFSSNISQIFTNL